MGRKIGIDLGTTYSCVYTVDGTGSLRLLPNEDGDDLTPSIVYINPANNEANVGASARADGVMDPDNYVERVKNYMGDPNYRFTDSNGDSYSAAAISTLILQKLVRGAEEALKGEEIEGAVITCPAYFGDQARAATKLAGESVRLRNGKTLTVLKILDEPTAAAIAYASTLSENVHKKVLIYDLGGGTFDLTLMQIDWSDTDRKMQVLTTAGNHQLGGKDWDAILTRLVIDKFCEATNCDRAQMENDPEMKVWFSENIEKAKRALTAKENTSLTIYFDGNKEQVDISRAEFEFATEALLSETIALIFDMFERSGLNAADAMDEIILVGGSTFMPQVKRRLQETFSKPLRQYEPNKAVAMGAALVASGAERSNARKGGTPSTLISSTLPSGEEREMTIVENCTKSYGFKILWGENDEVRNLNLILKDTPKPARRSSDEVTGLIITGAKGNFATGLNFTFFETDSKEDFPSDEEVNEMYEPGQIPLEEPAPCGAPIEVVLELDENGILSLTLTLLDTGKKYKMLPVRKSEASDQEGLDSVKRMTLVG